MRILALAAVTALATPALADQPVTCAQAYDGKQRCWASPLR
ncbi:hypothetical protein [Roseinatronobacter sp. NSM]